MSYLNLYGDPIIGVNTYADDYLMSKNDVKLEDVLSTQEIDDYKARFRFLPRPIFDAMMAQSLANYKVTGVDASLLKTQELMQDVAEGFEGTSKKIMYSLFLDLFNEVNIQEMTSRGIGDPWKWEEEKMLKLYETQAKGELAAMNPQLFLKENTSEDYNKLLMRENFENRAVQIAQNITDQGYKTQFLGSIKFMLDKEMWNEVKLILESYESMTQEFWDGMAHIF